MRRAIPTLIVLCLASCGHKSAKLPGAGPPPSGCTAPVLHETATEPVAYVMDDDVTTKAAVDTALAGHPEVMIRGWRLTQKAQTASAFQAMSWIPKAFYGAGTARFAGLAEWSHIRPYPSLFPGGTSDPAFLDLVSRTATGALSSFKDSGQTYYVPAYLNPKHVQYEEKYVFGPMLAGGANSVHIDVPFIWTRAWGYDDYAIAAFRTWLRGQMSDATLCSRYEICAGKAWGGPASFDYRVYLKDHTYADGTAYAADPQRAANPLSSLWGVDSGGPPRSRFSAGSFWAHEEMALPCAWAKSLHAFGTAKGVSLTVSANSLLPCMDTELDPSVIADATQAMTGGFDGRSLTQGFAAAVGYAKTIDPGAPVAFFIDYPPPWNVVRAWPPAMISQFVRLAGFEAVAAGGHFVYWLQALKNRDPTVYQSALDDLAFLEAHASLYDGSEIASVKAASSVPAVEAWLRVQPARKRWVLHLVNHGYDTSKGAVIPSGPVDVTFPAAAAPSCAPAFSPDWTGEGGVQVTVSKGTTTIHLASVTTYAVVVLDQP